ncbi:MAG: phosphoribosylanthranilate isomerase, partial [Candidatus Acidiferrales bacterium]
RFRVQELKQYARAGAFLLDASVRGKRGGTGKSFDWKKARPAGRYGRVLLAGGLTAENVAEAVEQAQPFGVDVCTGVESKPGVKNHALVRQFIRAAKSALKAEL